MTSNFTDRLANAESTIESLTDSVRDDDTDLLDIDDESTDSTVKSVVDDVRAIVTIVREAEDVLESIDVTDLPEAVDAEQVREAIQTGEIPDTLAEEEDGDVVELRQLIRAIDLGRTLAAVDVTSLWESKREIDDATDELGEEGDDWFGGDDGVLASDDEFVETELDEVVDTAAAELKGDIDIESGSLEAYQEVIQQQAIEGVDAFRDGLLQTHGTFERVVEENRERMRRQDSSPSSRNPTAVSTISSGRADVSSVPNYATMPRSVRHSNAPTRTHIYGDRFRRERQKRGYD